MTCQRCNSERIASFSAKCSDLGWASIGGVEKDGYLPSDMGVGGGDYLEIDVCLECGQLQGKWPLPECEMERKAQRKIKAAKTPKWMPNPRDIEACAEVVRYVKENPTIGPADIIGALSSLSLDESGFLVQAIVALHDDPDTEAAAMGVVVVLDGWEHKRELYRVLAERFPKSYAKLQKYLDDEDEDEDEYDD